jgi:NTE family protein
MDISLALGGGGAKGNAHIGVIRRLEKEGYRIRAVAGTSFGGVVAVFHASGYTIDRIEEMFADLDQTQLYGRGPNEGPSLMGLAGAHRWLEGIFGDRTFDDLRIPCAVTVVELTRGTEVTLSAGRLVDAILATIALPGIFPPRRSGELILVDGGVLNPVPVSVARLLAPHLPVVAVSLTEPLGSPTKSWSMPIPKYVPRTIVERLARLSYAQAFDIFLRSLDIVDRAMAEYRLAVDDPEILIRPNVYHIGLLEKVDVRAVARLGEEAVEAILPQLRIATSWHRRIGRKLFGGKK